MDLRKVSLVGFYNDKNQLLMQERGDYSKHGEEWAFFGGHAENGENPEETFLREAKEELDLDMKKFNYHFLGTFYFEIPEFNKKVERSIFLIKTDMKEEDFTVLEGAGAKYFDIEEAKKLKVASSIDQTLDTIKEYILSVK